MIQESGQIPTAYEDTMPLPAPASAICVRVGVDSELSSCSFIKNR